MSLFVENGAIELENHFHDCVIIYFYQFNLFYIIARFQIVSNLANIMQNI